MIETTITLHRILMHAYHGVLPQERVVGNDYEVTIHLGGDFSKAVKTDDVADAVNYADVFNVVKEQMAVPSNLLEHVAGRIARALMERFELLESVEVAVKKLNPPMGADCDGAEAIIKITI